MSWATAGDVSVTWSSTPVSHLVKDSVRLVMSYELLEMSGPELRSAGTAPSRTGPPETRPEATDQHLVTHWVLHQASALGSELGDALGPELGEAPPGVALVLRSGSARE
jgi:hypothetical protein